MIAKESKKPKQSQSRHFQTKRFNKTIFLIKILINYRVILAIMPNKG